MKYAIKHINVIGFLITFTLIIGGSTGMSLLLDNLGFLTRGSTLFFLILFGGIGIGFVFFFFFNGTKIYCEINETTLKINNKDLLWSNIKSYKIRNDSSEFTVFVVKTQQGKTFRVGHRNRISKDDFNKFLSDFEERVKILKNDKLADIQEIPMIWDTKTGKILGYVIIAFIIIMFGFIIRGVNNTKIYANFVIFTIISIPILFRIFAKK